MGRGGTRREMGAGGVEGFPEVRIRPRPCMEADPEIVEAVNASTFWVIYEQELCRVALQHRDGVNDDEGFMEEARAAFECAWDRQQNEGGHDIPGEFIHPVRWRFATTLWNKLAFPKPMDNRKGSWAELAVRDTIRTAQGVLAGRLERVDQKLPCHLAPPSVPELMEPDSSRRLPPILLHHSPPAHPEFIPHLTIPHLDPKPLKVDPQFRTPIRHVSFHHSSSANPQSFPIPRLDPKSLKVEPQFRTPIRQGPFQRTATTGLGDSDSDSESGDRPARDDGEVFATSEMFCHIDEHRAEQWVPDHHRPPESPERHQHEDLEVEESSGYDYGPEVEYDGYGSGLQEGYEVGYEDGYGEGYDEGYGDGYHDCWFDEDGYAEEERSSGDEAYADDADSDGESEGAAESDYQSDSEASWGE